MDLVSLPKAELHCHLDGMLDPPLLAALLAEGHALPIDPAALGAVHPARSAAGWAAWAQVAVPPLRGRLDLYAPILVAHIVRLEAQQVRYAEVMIAPSEVPRDPCEAVDRVGAFRAAVDARLDESLRLELLVTLNRRRGPEVVDAQATVALALFRRGLIVGVALAGDEPGNPVQPLARTFARLHEAGIGIEIHAGEWGGPAAIRDALEHGRPDRIGHALGMFEDPRLIETVRERGIHVELCPTSNLVTGSVARLEDHPIAHARGLGLRFSVNTDNPGPFACTLTSEFGLLAERFGFAVADFEAIYANTLAAGFGSRRQTVSA